jgi:spore coat polysaccharide biosynthesis protein SpsF
MLPEEDRMRVVAIIQARMGSTRLPGKVLSDLGGAPMLDRVVSRVRRATSLDDVLVATTTEAEDGAVAAWCAAHGCPCFRGSREDVLDRYHQAAHQARADAVVRITSDCPLIDAEVIDRVVTEFRERQPLVHYSSNGLAPRTYPRGLDTEVIRCDALGRAWAEDDNPAWREHVTPYIYRHPEMFHLHAVRAGADYSSLRWTVDTPADREFVLRVYDHFGNAAFTWRDVLALLSRHPEWLVINSHIEQKAV